MTAEKVDFFPLGARNIEQRGGEDLFAEEGVALGFAVFAAGGAVKFVDGQDAAPIAGEQENQVGLIEAERFGFAAVLVNIDVVDLDGAVPVGLGGETIFLKQTANFGVGGFGIEGDDNPYGPGEIFDVGERLRGE